MAITLRVVLVENLRRLAEAIVRGREARQEADALADDVLGLDDAPADPSVTSLQWVGDAPLVTAFAVQLVQRLREQDPAVTPALVWLDERLAAQGTTADDIVRIEHQRQAAMNVTVRNVILSMSLMSALDWAAFFESVSLVDDVLQASPTYGAMDFATRDAYRHAIEELARGSGRSELEVAREATRCAQRAEAAGARRHEAGYYLVANGRSGFEAALAFRAPPTRRLLRAYIAAATPGYLGTIAVLTGVILALPLLAIAGSGPGPAILLVLGLLALIPASDLAIALVNRSVGTLVTPGVLPRLELRGGVPATLRTMIVVPTLLSDRLEVDEQIERLEVHYLANPDGDLRFAMLSDWADAPEERMPGDEETLAAARDAIDRLNRRHGPAPGGGERFFVFHRRRVWNEGQQAWMGWERKRGKLHELNRLLRGATDTTFLSATGGAAVAPRDVRYIITLDADTQLPREAVNRLVGTMAHPLNRPGFDGPSGRVVEGYAVLQPRVTPPLPGGESSWFQRLSSGPSGIDPYAAAVSDVYQDLFGEGSYTGKGIYDVDALEAALAGRIPQNALLSHDLFEGIFARAGLVTDVELFEQAPSHYGVAAARQHRWARGDWQLLPWILGHRSRAIPMIGRWKMLDNLRRTLSAPTAFLADRLDRIRPRDDRAPHAAAGRHRGAPPGARHLETQPHPRRGSGRAPGGVAGGIRDDDARPPGVADERRDRADARADVRDASPTAGMGDGGASESRSPSRPRRLLPPDGRRRHPGGGGGGRRRLAATGILARRAAPAAALGRSAGGGAMDQPSVAWPADGPALGRGRARAPADRASDVALFRHVRRARGSGATARQLPGRSQARDRPPDLADEPRPVSALDGGGA